MAIGLTLGNQGRVLLAPCSIANIALAPVSRECPFDPTRVYVSPRGMGVGWGWDAPGMCRGWARDVPGMCRAWAGRARS